MDNLLQISTDRIRNKLNPINDKNGFLGANSSIDVNEVEETILEWTSYVIDRLPPRYKRLTTYIDGEVIFGNNSKRGVAKGGETTFSLGLANVSNVKLIKNFNKKRWSWRNYEDEMDESEYTVDEETGEIILNNALDKNDKLYAIYDHNNMKNCLTLKRIIIDLVAASYAKILFMDEERLTNFEATETQAYVDLQRIREDESVGKLNLKFFDDLDLIEETINDKTSGVQLLRSNSGLR